MTTRIKKTEIETNEIKQTKTVKKVPIEKEIKEEISTSNDMFSPENMAKMFAMFKQFEKMEQQQQIKEEPIITKSKEINGNTKFNKVMLSKIPDEIVTVKSAVDNVNFLSNKTQIRYKWLQKGDVEPLTISELLAMENVSRRFLHTPWLIVEDERVIQALDLQRTYDLISKVEDIDELVKLSKDEISKIFTELPKQYQNNFRNEIYKKVKTRELNNMSTIDDLGEILHIDFRNI